MLRTLVLSFGITGLVLFCVYAGLNFAVAQVMQSSNYQLQSDSINFGGGRSTSTSYNLESTAGEIATGESSSASFDLYAGYQQMQTVYIALSAVSDFALSPAIAGISGGESSGSTTVTVITDDPAGYQLTIAAENSPSMQSDTASINDYAPVGNPSFAFSYSSTEAVFAYSPEGSDVSSRFLDNGTDTCGGGGSNETNDRCWDGLSTTPTTIAQATDANHPSGTPTTIEFKVGVGGSVGLAPGTYAATTTLTALPL